MLVISSKEFRDKQASYFDRADNGEEIIVQRGKNKSYKVIAVSEDDTLMSKKELDAIIEQGLQDIQHGRGTVYTLEQLRVKMGLRLTK